MEKENEITKMRQLINEIKNFDGHIEPPNRLTSSEIDTIANRISKELQFIYYHFDEYFGDDYNGPNQNPRLPLDEYMSIINLVVKNLKNEIQMRNDEEDEDMSKDIEDYEPGGQNPDGKWGFSDGRDYAGNSF